jgi:hypothetical protein
MTDLNKFTITLTSQSKDRPPISYKVMDYFVSLMIENVLIPQKIILTGKWNINLAIMFLETGKFGPSGVYLYKPTTVSSDNVKFYPVQIPLKEIRESADPFLRTIELIYEGIKLFFIAHYKKIEDQFMDALWLKVDLNYLLSLPYPAKLTDQKYVGG